SNRKKNTETHCNNRLNPVIVRCDIVSRISKSPLSARLNILQRLRIKSAVYSTANTVHDPLVEPNNGLMNCSNLPEEAVKSGRNVQNKTRMSENDTSFSPSPSNFRFTRSLK